MLKINKFMTHKITALIVFLIAFFSTVINYSLRFSYIFIDSFTFEGLSLILWIISLINTFLCFFLLWSKLSVTKYKSYVLSQTKLHLTLSWISIILTVFYTVYDIVAVIIAGESIELAFKMFTEIMPIAAIIFVIFTLVFVLPLKTKKVRKITAWITTIIMASMLIMMIFPCYSYDFISDPVVFDNGEGYSVVFVTNDIGTGFVDYTFQGEPYRKYDENNGRLKGDSTIHTVKVPYEHLANNNYNVGSKRVIDELSYGGRYGKEITSPQHKLNVKIGDIEILTISDWHTKTKTAEKAIKTLGNYDYVFMLGDSAPGLMYEEEVAQYLISFGGLITKGSVPVLFTRGNHETRGKEASKLAEYLGMDKFYFNADIGGYNIIVLDSGEDKNDNHPEYGGMVNYNEYRKNMVKWLESQTPNSKKTLALSHDVEICIEDELSLRAYQKLSELNVSLIAGGHSHEVALNQLNDFSTFTDGGINGKDYVASKMTLNNNEIRLISKNIKGETVLERIVNWQ